jgi:hypothetical protein
MASNFFATVSPPMNHNNPPPIPPLAKGGKGGFEAYFLGKMLKRGDLR